MPSPGSVPPSPGRLVAILLIACLVPVGVGALVDVSSGDGTLVLSWAGAGGPVDAPAVGTADGRDDGADEPEPEATDEGSPRPYVFGSTSAAVGRPSSTTTTTEATTTTDTQPSTTAVPSSTTAAPRDPTTTATPAPAPAPSPTETVVALTNAARRDEAGCSALATDERLEAAAQAHSDDMVARDYFSHTSPDGTTFDERLRAAGYPRPGGENIAQGQRSAEAVVSAWMDSPGHRANILNCDFTTIGVGLHDGAWMWTQVFGY